MEGAEVRRTVTTCRFLLLTALLISFFKIVTPIECFLSVKHFIFLKIVSLFLVRKIGPELTSVANLLFFFFPLPKAPRYIVVYILVVGSSPYSMWDATSAWLDEWC